MTVRIPRFLNNKYRRWYNALIERARSRDPPLVKYFEKHHVIPKSIGGERGLSNKVNLTYREHFLAHWLLIKFTTGDAQNKMRYALKCLTTRKNGSRIVSSWQYEIVRRHFRILMEDYEDPPEVRARRRVSALRVGALPEVKARRRAAQALVNSDPEVLARKSAAQTKANARPEVKRNKSESARRAHARPGAKELRGASIRRSHARPETQAKLHGAWARPGERDRRSKAISLAKQEARRRRKPITCPHCGKIGSLLAQMHRYHFDNCKKK